MSRIHRLCVVEHRLNIIAELPAPLAGDVVVHVDALLNVAAGFGDYLAHLARHLAREVVLAREHDLRGPEEDLAALRGGVEAPTIESAPGRVDGTVNVGDRRFRDVRDELTGRGIDVLERAAFSSVDPAAIDVVLERGRRHP